MRDVPCQPQDCARSPVLEERFKKHTFHNYTCLINRLLTIKLVCFSCDSRVVRSVVERRPLPTIEDGALTPPVESLGANLLGLPPHNNTSQSADAN